MASLPACAVCDADSRTSVSYGARSCPSCSEFFRRRVDNDPGACAHGGKFEITLHTRHLCAPCRFRKCRTAGMRPRASATPAPSQGDETTQHSTEAGPAPATPPCIVCDSVNIRKQIVTCPQPAASPPDLCGLTRVQAQRASHLELQRLLASCALRRSSRKPPCRTTSPPLPIWRQAWPTSSDACGYPHTFRAENNTGKPRQTTLPPLTQDLDANTQNEAHPQINGNDALARRIRSKCADAALEDAPPANHLRHRRSA
ncbi:Nuclear hormone receptor family member nhr-61 [Chionoecetes opilio]|uniref:Nuclear hormone receptor family member nhr-61 n=1 Tax=Chionoecetes opilio TaxID=41210 RepID=A0A8J4Y662_CHIOP|nr:Nuclear hormone receptor family member nhr-61 [Chionoecetes opilio]